MRTCRSTVLGLFLGMLVTGGISSGPVAAGGDPETSREAQSFPEAERLFRQDPRWLGSDGANSAPLGDGRVFWTFEDSFVAMDPPRIRRNAVMIRNSVAVQTGLDPNEASLEFHWGRGPDGEPEDFFPPDGDRWYWTGASLRLEQGPLLTFLYRIRPTPGEGLGFANDGFALAIIDDPDQPPEGWRPRIIRAPTPAFDAVPATALFLHEQHIVGLATAQQGVHRGYLVRYAPGALAAGILGSAEWWAGSGRGWLPESALGPEGPRAVIDDAGSESSLHYDAARERWVHVTTYGFGDAWVGLRTAPSATGPWSAPRRIYTPPELKLPRPFVYSALAHPELVAPGGGLVITYATNAFDFEELLSGDGAQKLYWPRVISLDLVALQR